MLQLKKWMEKHYAKETHRRRCGQPGHAPKHGELVRVIVKQNSDLQTQKSNRLNDPLCRGFTKTTNTTQKRMIRTRLNETLEV